MLVHWSISERSGWFEKRWSLLTVEEVGLGLCGKVMTGKLKAAMSYAVMTTWACALTNSVEVRHRWSKQEQITLCLISYIAHIA